MLLPVHDVSCRTLNEIPMGLQPAAAGGASTVPRTRARPWAPGADPLTALGVPAFRKHIPECLQPIAEIAQPLQPIVYVEKSQLAPPAVSSNPSPRWNQKTSSWLGDRPRDCG